MKRHPYLFIISVSALLVPALFGCKTSEENYRAAYEKTVEGRKEQAVLDSTIYGADRRTMSQVTLKTDAGDVDVRRMRVRVTDGQSATAADLHQYNVVAGQFKQLFNARSLCRRLADAGYKAFVVETAEPYYYIIAESTDDLARASAAKAEIKAKAPVSMKAPLPFILEATGRHIPAKK